MIENPKHTPGPWRLRASMTGTYQVESLNFRIAEVMGHVGDSEIEANARLIEASPDLLKALEECVGLLMDIAPDASDDLLAVVDARAAIAKATGTNEAN